MTTTNGYFTLFLSDEFPFTKKEEPSPIIPKVENPEQD
jgi:hypothetical protein